MPRIYPPAVGPSSNKAEVPGQEKKKGVKPGMPENGKGNESGGK